MLTKFTPIITAVILCFGFISCQKELADERTPLPGNNIEEGTSSGTAVFSLKGAPNVCNNHVINGSYCAGMPLGAGNTVNIQVMVSTVGTYYIATRTINGIMFSGTGTFMDTGLQEVVLNGSGTPLSEGTMQYRPGNSSCSFPITVNISPKAEGNLDCTQAWSDGNFVHGTRLNDSNKLHIPVFVTTAGNYCIQTDLVNGASFSGTGHLDAGNQVITLSGSGIPQNAGAYQLTITLGMESCSFWITYQ